MSNYQKRGLHYLIIAVVFAALFFLLRRTGSLSGFSFGALGVAIGSALIFFWYRQMTEEEFEARRKKEKKANDERSTVVSGKAAGITCLVLVFSLSAGTIYFSVVNNEAAALAMGLQILILAVIYLIATAVLNRKV